MRSRLLNLLPVRCSLNAATTLLGIASLLLLPAPRVSSAAPPAPGQVKGAKANNHPPKKQIPDLDNWYGVFVDSQHLGYLHIGGKQRTFTSPAQWDCVIDMYANPSPGNPATVQQKIKRCIMRESDGILESWDTTTEGVKRKPSTINIRKKRYARERMSKKTTRVETLLCLSISLGQIR